MLKETIRKLSLELLGSAAVGIVVSFLLTVMLAGLLEYTVGKILVSVFLILLFGAFIYSSAWREGARDPNRIKYGHMNPFMLKGLVSGLFASIPFFILYLMLAITAITNNGYSIIRPIFNVINIQYIQILNVLPSPFFIHYCAFPAASVVLGWLYTRFS